MSTALHDDYEARSLERLDAALARGPVPDQTRSLGSSGLRELARDPSLPLCLRRHFLGRAVEVAHKEQDAERIKAWQAAHPVPVLCPYGCAGVDGRHFDDCPRAE